MQIDDYVAGRPPSDPSESLRTGLAACDFQATRNRKNNLVLSTHNSGDTMKYKVHWRLRFQAGQEHPAALPAFPCMMPLATRKR